jgi:protoheme IX farnesyltransferase
VTAVDPHVSAAPRAPGPSTARSTARDVLTAYVGLMKPRIIELLLLTTVPVMFLAQGGVPSLPLVVATVLGGTLSAGSANALNCVYDAWSAGVPRWSSASPSVSCRRSGWVCW